MSSPCRCAAAIIARSIAVAMKPHGGKRPALIRPSLPARCGWRRIRCRQAADKMGSEGATSLAAVGTDQRSAKRDRPVSKRGPNDKTKPISRGWPPMTSFRQIEANRRNARKSTGPITEEGKQRSRCNAVRHGLTAETVIGALEDAEDYKAFEAAIIADYDAQSAVERELVLRLASLLWRLRRATTMETGLFEIQADHLSGFRQARQVHPASREVVYALFGRADSGSFDRDPASHGITNETEAVPSSMPKSVEPAVHPTAEFARCFLRLANLPNYALDRLSRYEATLWRQVRPDPVCARCLGSPQTTRKRAPFPYRQPARTAGLRARGMLSFERRRSRHCSTRPAFDRKRSVEKFGFVSSNCPARSFTDCLASSNRQISAAVTWLFSG